MRSTGSPWALSMNRYYSFWEARGEASIVRNSAGSGDVLIQTLALFLPTCVTLGKLLNPSGP